MDRTAFGLIAAVALGLLLVSTPAFSQSQAGRPQSPGWYMEGSAQDPNGPAPPADIDGRGARGGGGAGRGAGRGARGPVGVGGNNGFNACIDDIVKFCTGLTAGAATTCLNENSAKISAACKAELVAPPREPNPSPSCSHSPVCGNRVAGGGSGAKGRVGWFQTMGYTYAYPFTDLPQGGGGVSAVALDSKGNLWAFQRNAFGKPQLFKFGPDRKLILSVGEDVLTHQFKAHGIKVDAQDNVWICDEDGATIKKISPGGKVLLTLGERGHRGDWDEAKGQRLLWQPVHIDFGPNGDIYIFEGHANESPNDTDSGDPTNNIGAARVIHLDKNAKFITQWFGNSGGPGKFAQTHGSAVDPTSGDVYLGDREEYRIVVYDKDGKFIKTLSMRNLVCAMAFDRSGQLWMASGQDGQFLKIDRDGNVLGAVGRGSGRGEGQFIEASYFAFDKQGNMYAGDTSVGRITMMVAPKR